MMLPSLIVFLFGYNMVGIGIPYIYVLEQAEDCAAAEDHASYR